MPPAGRKAFMKHLLRFFPNIGGEVTRLARMMEDANFYLPNLHRHIDETLDLADHLIDGSGVEAIHDNDWGPYYLSIGVLYVNVGDPYRPTVLYDTRKGAFYVVNGYGDYIESEERRGRKFQ